MAERWAPFGGIPTELGSRFNNHGHARDELFDYIEVFYNQQLRHSAIGYISPAEYERTIALESSQVRVSDVNNW